MANVIDFNKAQEEMSFKSFNSADAEDVMRIRNGLEPKTSLNEILRDGLNGEISHREIREEGNKRLLGKIKWNKDEDDAFWASMED